MMRYLRKKLQLLCILASVAVACSALVTPVQTVTAQSSKARSMIAFVTADYTTRTTTISLADPARKTITTLVKDGVFSFPMLSPDGRHLAFVGAHPRRGRGELYIIDTDGSNLRRFNAGRQALLVEGQVAWSPDSTQILFGAIYGNGVPAGFFRVNLDGSNLKEIVFKDKNIDRYDPNRIISSPDGSHKNSRKGTVVLRRQGNCAVLHSEIYFPHTFALTGTVTKHVTNFRFTAVQGSPARKT